MTGSATAEIVESPPDFRWPGGRHVAVVFTIAYETWSEGTRSAVGPMGNPLPGNAFDYNAHSYGQYGARTGIKRLARLLEDAGVTGDILMSGALADQDPARVRALADAGHTIIGHGYTQDRISSLLSEEEDLDAMTRTAAAVEAVTGVRPRGWVSPRATSGEPTLRRLAQSGYDWHGDVLDRDLPYLQRFPEGTLVAIPEAMEFNDLAHSMRFGRTPQQFVDMFHAALPHLLKAEDDTVIIDILAHAHCYGRAASAWAYGEIARACAERDDIWLTSRDQIATHLRDTVAS